MLQFWITIGILVITCQVLKFFRLRRLQETSCFVDGRDLRKIPISEWSVRWFFRVENAELKRQFLQERGIEIFDYFDYRIISIWEKYNLIEYKLRMPGRGLVQKFSTHRALVFNCMSSEDRYFMEVPPKIQSAEEGVRFLNDNIGKEELVHES